MAPTSRKGSKATRKASKPRRTQYKKKKLVKPKISDQMTAALMEDLPSNDDICNTTSPCSTPKAQRFRIPKIDTCPPAPKKQRLLSDCSLQRTPIAFFAPPDLELFFFELRDIPI